MYNIFLTTKYRDKIELVEQCYECNGKGIILDVKYDKREKGKINEIEKECFVCNGKGIIPNENGDKILEFINFFY